MSGYSRTPLVKKLGIKDSSRIFLVNAPIDYLSLITPLPAGVTFESQITEETDIVQIFVTERFKLERELRDVLSHIRPDGIVWVSWPKKSSRVPTDITEDVIREVALPLGLVDIKVCAVDETWSGLKLMLRKENRR